MNRGAVNNICQIGVETTPGTAVAANRRLPSLSFLIQRNIEAKKFRARGAKVDTVHVQHKKMAVGNYEGILDYNSLIYVCDGLFPAATASQIGAIGAYTRIWTPGVRSADSTRKTFTTEIGDAVACEDYPYTQLNGFSMEASQDDFSINGPIIARYPTDNQALAGSPTEIPERPVERNDVNVYIDDTHAGLGTTQLAEALEESISLGEKFNPFFVHNRTASEFHDIVEKPYEPTMSFSSVHNSASRTLIDSINTNPIKFIRWEAQGAMLGTHSSVDYYEIIRFDMCVKFDGTERIEDEDGPLGYKYNCTMIPDVDLGGFMKITSICSRATL